MHLQRGAGDDNLSLSDYDSKEVNSPYKELSSNTASMVFNLAQWPVTKAVDFGPRSPSAQKERTLPASGSKGGYARSWMRSGAQHSMIGHSGDSQSGEMNSASLCYPHGP